MMAATPGGNENHRTLARPQSAPLIGRVQKKSVGQERHKSAARLQMEAIEQAKAANRLGARSINGFHRLLKRKYGNPVRGWRLGLDVDGSGKLSYMEFCTAVRGMGYEG